MLELWWIINLCFDISAIIWIITLKKWDKKGENK